MCTLAWDCCCSRCRKRSSLKRTKGSSDTWLNYLISSPQAAPPTSSSKSYTHNCYTHTCRHLEFAKRPLTSKGTNGNPLDTTMLTIMSNKNQAMEIIAQQRNLRNPDLTGHGMLPSSEPKTMLIGSFSHLSSSLHRFPRFSKI